MKELKFIYEESALIAKEKLNETGKKLKEEIGSMKAATGKHYEDERASINLPEDKEMLHKVRALIKEKLELRPKYLVLVGIGGSNLGTLAVAEAVLGKRYNQLNPEIGVLYADTVDSDSMNEIIGIIEPILKNGDNIIVNGVSKSGGTTETIANFEIILDLMQKYKEDYRKYVIVTTDENSKFWQLATEEGFDVLPIPKKVGGRYSVLSPVGLFPLGLIGIDIDKLLQGAAAMKKECLNEFWNNPAAISAALLYLHSREGKKINDMFFFANDLESVGKWYRQLMGESIGKEFSRGGEQVFEGITPTVSLGSTDLHSMAQLYLGGPYDKFTTFVRLERHNTELRLPNIAKYSKLVDKVQGRELSEIMNAILEGVQIAFKKGKRPFAELKLPDKTAYSIGQMMQFKMMEMMYLGYLLGVNPFDQPNVDSYKVETKKILAKD